jgi:lipoyl synthase
MDLIQIESTERRPNGQLRLPSWLRKSQTHFREVDKLRMELRSKKLHTVCESARCPNMHECWHRGAATFMILGNFCTRGCGFCSVPKFNPKKTPMGLDPDEPKNVARQAAMMGLRYVVITSVNRDELPDGGAAHWAATIRAVRQALPSAKIEVLTPDFNGNHDAVATVLEAGPHVFNHNMETVSRLYKRVRPQANYQQSLDVLKFTKRTRADILTKSGLMVGLGESPAEVEQLLRDVAAHSADVVTIGQYLQPSRKNLPVAEYVSPQQFDAYQQFGQSIGLRKVFSGPFVRSSYMADLVSEEAHALLG